MVPPSAAFTCLIAARSRLSVVKRRCGADARRVEPRGGGRRQPGPQRLDDAAAAGAQLGRHAGAQVGPGPGQAGADAAVVVIDLGPQQLGAARGRPRRPRRRRADGGVGGEAQQLGQERGPGDAVDHRVVHLGDQREAAIAQALDDPRLPQRVIAIEALAEQPAGQRVELRGVAGRRQAGVADVVVEDEALVVDPHRLADHRHPHHPLPVARQAGDRRRDVRAHTRRVDRAARVDQVTAGEHAHRADRHRGARRLDLQERRVESRQALEVTHGIGASKRCARSAPSRAPRTRGVDARTRSGCRGARRAAQPVRRGPGANAVARAASVARRWGATPTVRVAARPPRRGGRWGRAWPMQHRRACVVAARW
jgi:hypothetical protein